MDPEFWHTRWAANEIGFHQREINAHLQRHWRKLGLAQGSRILVPLCGKSLDLLWLAEQGHAVVGIEISELAVAAFFRENDLRPLVDREDSYSHWSCDGIEILCGDFFNLPPESLGELDGCYDRAALVALPASLRPHYAARLASLLPDGSRGLLVTMDYLQAAMAGPPFAVSNREVEQLFAGSFGVEHLEQFDALAASPGFRDRGLDALTEHVWSLRRR